MTARERLIAAAAAQYAVNGLIPTDLHARLLEHGVDVDELFGLSAYETQED